MRKLMATRRGRPGDDRSGVRAGRTAGEPDRHRGHRNRREVRSERRRADLQGRQMDRDHLRPSDQARPRRARRRPAPSYGKVANPDAPVWRAGANNTTQLKTEVPLVINGKTVAPGTYTMFIDLKPNAWTLIVSNWKAQTRYDPKNTAEIWGAYGYTPDKDVVRAPMTLGTLPFSVDQLTWEFTDMSDAGGKLTIMWDKTVASVPFKVQ